MPRKASLMVAALASSMASSLAAMAAVQSARIFGAEPIRRYLQRRKRDHARGARNSIAKLNRWTGQPHEHCREIARNQRRATR